MQFAQRIHTVKIFFFLALLLVLLTRLVIYLGYNLKIMDTDQAYMWLGARDYAAGNFYEPRYYGQDYNTFMEALFAVPLLWLKIPVFFAVPAATHLISLFPFLFSAIFLFFKNKVVHAYLVLAILLCLPPQYDLLNSLPRGFVTGLFFTGFFIASAIYPNNLFFAAINLLMALIGYFVNQNSVLVSLPFLFYVYLHQFKNPKFYLVMIPVLALFWPLRVFFDSFYLQHPDYIYQGITHNMSLKSFVQSITSLDQRFQHISFFISGQSFTLLLALLLTGVLLYKQNKNAFFAYVFFIILVLISFASDKVAGGSSWVFMSYSRMYLGIPLALGLFWSFLNFERKWFGSTLLVLPLFFTAYKFTSINSQLDKEDIRDVAQGVRVVSLDQCRDVTMHYKKACNAQNVDFFLVSTTFWLNTIVNCAGPALYDDYPETQETRFEKRYWVRNTNKNRVIKKFVFLSSDYNLDKLLPVSPKFKLNRIDDYGLFLIDHNQLTMGEFIELVNKSEPELNE